MYQQKIQLGNTSEVYEFKVPELKLTSKVNLESTSGKGKVELDWSDYELEDKYFIIYRKEENSNEWEKIVTLEQKLIGGTYIDNVGNDKTIPSTPTINIEVNNENNNIKVNQSADDNGTKYTYYIECYDSGANTLLAVSNKTTQ